jgi:hypothetical protein
MTPEYSEAGRGASRSVWPFVSIRMLTPLLWAVLGIDGGPIFQILAVENLGLSAAAIGIAFGFGVVSLPFQVLAARMPFMWARRNVQWFFMIAALQACLLAVLVVSGAAGPPAVVALVVTVTAEVTVSVLFVTAWQPLLSARVSAVDRQQLNARWTGIGRGILAGALVLFAALGAMFRAAFLVVVGVLALGAAVSLTQIESPKQPLTAPADHPEQAGRHPLGPTLRRIFLVQGVMNVSALPLWLVYLDQVLWPTVNLGVIAACQTVTSVLVLLAWRPTSRDVGQRAWLASIVAVGAAVLIAVVRPPVDDSISQAVTVVGTVVLGGSTTLGSIALLELAHQTVTPHNTVRAFTLLDVVASTMLQVGLLFGGVLITVSATTAGWILDPYQLYVLLCAIGTLVAMWRLRATHR